MPIEFQTIDPSLIDTVNAFVLEWNSNSDAIITKTSGSTGKPKSIRILKKFMMTSAIATGNFLGLKRGDTALLCLSPETIGGKMMLVRSIVLDLHLIVVDVNSEPLKSISQPIEFAAMVPLQLQRCLDESPEKLSLIRQLIIGGAPVSDVLIQRLEKLTCHVFHTFGMTETISHIALRKLNNPLELYFHTLPEIRLQVDLDNGLIINAPTIGIESLHTNDTVELVDENTFRWLGRKDLIINSGGIKIHPEEIESKLSEYLKFPYFVCGAQDELLGEKLILHVEQAALISLTKLDLFELLGKHRTPKEIHYHTSFEYTTSGKIDRIATLNSPKSVVRKVL